MPAAPEPNVPKRSTYQRGQHWVRRHSKQLLADARLARLTANQRQLNAERSLEPVFVTGMQGSGTSLLAMAMYQSLAMAGITYESALQVARSSGLRVRPGSRYPSLDAYHRAISETDAIQDHIGHRSLLDLYRGVASYPGKKVVDKGPCTNMTRAAKLHRWFPEAQFVLVYRDPRANIEGLLRKFPLFSRAGFDATLEFYNNVHMTFLDETERLQLTVMVVNYSAYVAAPTTANRNLADWLATPMTEGDKSMPERPNTEGQGIRNITGGQIGVVTDADVRAVERLDPALGRQVLDTTGPLLDRLATLEAEP